MEKFAKEMAKTFNEHGIDQKTGEDILEIMAMYYGTTADNGIETETAINIVEDGMRILDRIVGGEV